MLGTIIYWYVLSSVFIFILMASIAVVFSDKLIRMSFYVDGMSLEDIEEIKQMEKEADEFLLGHSFASRLGWLSATLHYIWGMAWKAFIPVYNLAVLGVYIFLIFASYDSKTIQKIRGNRQSTLSDQFKNLSGELSIELSDEDREKLLAMFEEFADELRNPSEEKKDE